MKKLLLPLVLLIAGTGAGIGAGLFLMPDPAPDEDGESAAQTDAAGETGGEVVCFPAGEVPGTLPPAPAGEAAAETPGLEYARLANQFVVPVVTGGEVEALVVLSLSVEVPAGQLDPVFAHEPKLRDVFLQVLFDHANAGGFEGVFTSSANMRTLRTALRNAAREVLGPTANDVLVVDLVRQDMRS